MLCPNCKENSISYWDAFLASPEKPAICGNCSKRFWVHRILTKIINTAAHGYGVGTIVLLLVFVYKWYLGVALIASFTVLRVVIAAYELWLHGLKECESVRKT